MSTVSLNAGDTGWLDSVTCDSCGAKVERKGTGQTTRVALSITDPRVQASRLGHGLSTLSLPLPEIEYENRDFEPHVLKGWGTFGIRGSGDDDPRVSMDFCPACAQVATDMFLERVKDPKSNAPFGTQEEWAYGVEVPADLAPSQQIGDFALTRNAMRTASEQQTAMSAALSIPVRQRGTYYCSASNCGHLAMASSFYCYEHAARAR